MRRYGRWAGQPKGMAEHEGHCIASVYSGGRFISSQCGRKRGHGPNDEFCKQHARMIADGKNVYVPDCEPLAERTSGGEAP